MNRLLILRERVEGKRTAELVTALGYQPVCLPVETVTQLSPPVMQTDFSGFLVTSRNGVDWLANHYADTDKAVLAVGPGTGDKLREAGFSNIEEADGDGASLARLAASRNWAGPLLYAAGRIRRPDLEQALIRENIAFETVEVYNMRAKLPDRLEVEAALALPVTGVMLLSATQAHSFGELVKHYSELLQPLPTAFCLSGRIAAALSKDISTKVAIAERPVMESLLALLQSYRCRMS